MQIKKENYFRIIKEVQTVKTTLVAVSKIQSIEAIKALHELGQRDFGENYVQELVDKQSKLPADIRWHYIGHLQSNKVKYIAAFIHLIHGIDSLKLLKDVNKQAQKNNRTIDVLLQVHIAQEQTKFGLDESELDKVLTSKELPDLKNIRVVGLMGMASFSDDEMIVRNEFKNLKRIFDNYSELQTVNCKLQTLSMGMSADYKIAIEEGSNMIRVGSLLFGGR